MAEISFREYVEFRLDTICRQVKKNEEAIDSLIVTRAELSGKADQSSVWLAYLISGVGLIIAVLNLVVRLGGK